jgi:hypothetical protein
MKSKFNPRDVIFIPVKIESVGKSSDGNVYYNFYFTDNKGKVRNCSVIESMVKGTEEFKITDTNEIKTDLKYIIKVLERMEGGCGAPVSIED